MTESNGNLILGRNSSQRGAFSFNILSSNQAVVDMSSFQYKKFTQISLIGFFA